MSSYISGCVFYFVYIINFLLSLTVIVTASLTNLFYHYHEKSCTCNRVTKQINCVVKSTTHACSYEIYYRGKTQIMQRRINLQIQQIIFKRIMILTNVFDVNLYFYSTSFQNCLSLSFPLGFQKLFNNVFFFFQMFSQNISSLSLKSIHMFLLQTYNDACSFAKRIMPRS